MIYAESRVFLPKAWCPKNKPTHALFDACDMFGRWLRQEEARGYSDHSFFLSQTQKEPRASTDYPYSALALGVA
jgi:hypothetical protein